MVNVMAMVGLTLEASRGGGAVAVISSRGSQGLVSNQPQQVISENNSYRDFWGKILGKIHGSALWVRVCARTHTTNGQGRT